jgi:ABC-type Na+ efflux pump permease subunit
MVFLPVVERELRVASRGRATYRVRFWSVFVMLGVFIYFLCASGIDQTRNQYFGMEAMSVLLIPAFVLSLFIGVIATADCVSSEKREGTLGLLFLTDLKGYDVICGKLAANSLNALYGLVAILPVMSLPVMLGGVTFVEFVKLAICLLSTMILSLSVGIYVSTCSRSDRKALFFTVLILLAIAILPFLITEIFDETYQSIPENELWKSFLFSPAFGVIQTMTTTMAATSPFPDFSYWLSILWQWLLAAALIAAASSRVPHSWEESVAKKSRRPSRFSLGFRVKARSPKGRAWLERNPFLWLALQGEESSPRNVWLFVLAVLAIWLFAAIKLGMNEMADQGVVTMAAWVFMMPLQIWIVAQASRRFSEDRSNNTFEALLSTPLNAPQIVQGQWLALIKQFAGPIVLVLAWELFMGITPLSWREHDTRTFWLQMVHFVAETAALAWAGMWLGLKCKGRIRAILGTLFLVMFAPWLVTTVIIGMLETLVFQPGSVAIAYPQNAYPQSQIDFQNCLVLIVASGIPLLIYILIAVWAKSRLSRNFRQMAVRR